MLDTQVYDSFFDELALIEKHAMIQKEAAGLWQGVKTLVNQGLGKTISQAGTAFQRGFAGANRVSKGQGGLMSGLKSVAATPGGKALLAGAVAVPVAAGVGGYMLGSSRGQGQQPVYMNS